MLRYQIEAAVPEYILSVSKGRRTHWPAKLWNHWPISERERRSL